MPKDNYSTFFKVGAAVAFLVMIIVNGLANGLPLNGQNTGAISDSYPNLFAPAGITFAIWGLIYLLLACYTLYQFGLFQKGGRRTDPALLKRISSYFILSSFANAAWIFAWHYRQLPVSVILMAVILVSLILVNREIGNAVLSTKETFFLRTPFSVYFGWITVAAIANVTVLLVSLRWNAFGIPEPVWASIMMLVGMLIGVAAMLKNRDIAYGLVLIWAYSGILLKHMAASGFNGQYPLVIGVAIACIVLFLAAEAFLLLFGRKDHVI